MSDPKSQTPHPDDGGAPAPAKPAPRRPLLFKTAAGAIPLATPSRSNEPDEHGHDGDS